MKRSNLRVDLCAGVAAVALIGFSGTAHAQSAQTPPVDATATATEAPANQQDIVVTGSRIVSGKNSPTPVTIASTKDLLEAQPASVVQGLNTLPGLLGSLNPTSNVNTGGYNTLNLRGIGTTRALILYDGHRVGPTLSGVTASTAGATDVDVIPQILLQRVEVVTGGASAVYGSDAVSGVVNFITDTKFEGLKLNIQSGISTYGDDSKFDVGAAWGKEFAGGRGHFEVGYEYRDAPGIIGRRSRPFFDSIYTEQGSVPNSPKAPGNAANPYKLYSGAVISTASFGGLINNGPLSGLNFTNNGTLTPFVHGALTGTPGVEVGGDGAYYTGSSIAASQRLHQGFARLDYNLTDNIHAYVQGAVTSFNQGYTQQNVFLSKVAIGYNNAFLSTLQPQYQAVVQSQLAAAAPGTNPSFQFSKMETMLPDYRINADETYYMAIAGLDGSLGKFQWNIDYDHTDSKLRVTNENNVNTARLYAALNAVRDPATGNIVCNAALANPSAYGSCVPLNVFGPTSENQSAIDYVEQATSALQHYWGDDVSATIKGSLFDLPAGPLKVALSGEWRKLSYEVKSNQQPTDPVNCNGIQFNCSATVAPYNGGSVEALAPVSQTVSEAALETDIPILSGLSFVKAFNVNAGVRFTHYDTSGDAWTWKVGGDWQINDTIRLRATRSRDIRAPNLTDLFSAPTYTLRNYLDLHTGGSGLIYSVAQGNPGLKPEKANTITAGVVLTPQFAHGLSVTVDYYNIKINQAIVSIDAFQPANQQVCETSGGTSSICDLYIRPHPFSDTSADNYPTQLLVESLNLASLKTYGVDVEANYDTTLAQHDLTLRALVNWQPHLIFNNGPSGIVDVGGAADGQPGLPPIPKVKVVASVGYNVTDSFRFFVQERWRAALKQNGTPGLIFADPNVPAMAYTDITLTQDIAKKFSLFVNVQNLFNKTPPVFASSGGSLQPNYLGGYAQGDDIEGRYITVGVRLKM